MHNKAVKTGNWEYMYAFKIICVGCHVWTLKAAVCHRTSRFYSGKCYDLAVFGKSLKLQQCSRSESQTTENISKKRL